MPLNVQCCYSVTPEKKQMIGSLFLHVQRRERVARPSPSSLRPRVTHEKAWPMGPVIPTAFTCLRIPWAHDAFFANNVRTRCLGQTREPCTASSGEEGTGMMVQEQGVY